MRPGGRANAPGDIHESASLLEHLYRAKLATLEASSNDADLLSVARSALDNAVIAAELGAGRALYLEEAVREAIGYSSSQIAADAPGYPRLTDSSAGLTPRELDVLRLVADGLTNQEIADMLCISLRTVTSHITHVLTKLALTSRTAAVSHAIRHGLI
jgi:DNA-binding NarL/FixJ family response regulator